MCGNTKKVTNRSQGNVKMLDLDKTWIKLNMKHAKM